MPFHTSYVKNSTTILISISFLIAYFINLTKPALCHYSYKNSVNHYNFTYGFVETLNVRMGIESMFISMQCNVTLVRHCAALILAVFLNYQPLP